MDNKPEEGKSAKSHESLILFDKGFNDIQELSVRKKLTENNSKRKPITWYTLYMILFNNTLSSRSLIPKEELKLRLNIIRKYLPPFYNAPKSSENINSNSLLKKFTYHVYSKNNFYKKLLEKSKERASIFLFEEGENKEKEENERPQSPVFQRRIRKTKTQKFTSSNINLFNFGGRRGSIGRIKPLESNDLKAIQEYSPKKENKISKNLMRVDSPNRRKIGKRSTLKMEGQMINKLVFNQRKKKQNSNLYFFELERKAKLKMDKQNELTDLEKIDTDFLIRTPKDNEFSLELSDKRTMNGNRTYFYEYLNKLNLETKNEKINTYKREVATQLLKFNDFYFDSKLEDFGHDKLFSEIKGNCDLFINKFKMDKYEEKKISDLEKFL